jgi:hypothetical protein
MRGVPAMKKYYRILILMILTSAIFLAGCGAQKKDIMAEDSAPIEMSSAPMIEEALESDYLKKQIEGHILNINPNVKLEKGHYAIGDLTGDDIPELVLFIERNPMDVNDQGLLEVYGFNELNHYLIDSIPMNYDNTNYILKTGFVSLNKQGILLSNQVGSQAGVTYGYILENNKLRSILNPKKVNLVSVTANNSIEDVNGDGVLDFSIYTIDPETTLNDSQTAARILLWYNWDEKDGAVVLQPDWTSLQRSTVVFDSVAESKAVENQELPIPGNIDFLEMLDEYSVTASKSEVSSLLADHLNNLEINGAYRTLDVAALSAKYTKNSTLDDYLDERGISIAQLNDKGFLSAVTTFKSERDLKEMLLKNLELGYLLRIDNGRYEYKVNYEGLINRFNVSLTNEFKGYLRIISRESSSPHVVDGKLAIDRIVLGERLVEIENFRLTYNYSQNLGKVLELYSKYMQSLLYLSKGGDAFDPTTGKSAVGHLEELQSVADAFPNSYFADVVMQLQKKLLASNSGVIDQNNRDEINFMIP